MRYLSLEWIEALSREVASSDAVAALAVDHSLGFTQVVSNGPEGDVVYHLQVGEGRASFGPGAAWPEDVRFEQDWETALAVATDRLNAQQAFMTGRIRLHGDQQKLAAGTPVFAALDAVFKKVRELTVYE